eukprot:2292673-Rhodomonas_salina.1
MDSLVHGVPAGAGRLQHEIQSETKNANNSQYRIQHQKRHWFLTVLLVQPVLVAPTSVLETGVPKVPGYLIPIQFYPGTRVLLKTTGSGKEQEVVIKIMVLIIMARRKKKTGGLHGSDFL